MTSEIIVFKVEDSKYGAVQRKREAYGAGREEQGEAVSGRGAGKCQQGRVKGKSLERGLYSHRQYMRSRGAATGSRTFQSTQRAVAQAEGSRRRSLQVVVQAKEREEPFKAA